MIDLSLTPHLPNIIYMHAQDINECTESTHDCDQNAACLNEPIGSYTCQCTVGFIGDGKNCTERDECVEFTPCNNGGTCTDLVNNYSCDCTGTGYKGEVSLSQLDPLPMHFLVGHSFPLSSVSPIWYCLFFNSHVPIDM